MKNKILSLKSLYRFLVINDYPVYSAGIIRKNNHTGLTLTKFWQENLLIDFRKHKCGKMIWRAEGGRNRYISEICNRSDSLRFYREYAEEIFGEAKPETVCRQIRQFASFLMERQFDYDAFIKKLPAYIELITKNDVIFSKEPASFFKDNLKKQKEYSGKRNAEQAFFCGWFLTFLMLHALTGNGEGEETLRRLRNDPTLSLEELEKNFLQSSGKRQEQVIFLSGKNTELCSTPLEARHFFGREEELFELREMLERGGRYLVSGIGGIGKTELMRQFLKHCEEEALTEYICVVQYENSLVDSLIKAFPQIHGRNRDENFNEALAIIRMHAGERILLVIDNMNHDQNEDEDIKILSKIPATIFATSRYQKISGFETYPIRPISKNAGSLVFRDNYRKPLLKEDKQALEVILNNDIWCHTLTLRLLGSVAGSRGWSLQELLVQLEKGVTPTGLEKQDGYAGLKQIYCRMYAVSVLSGELGKLLKVFAVLPYASYTLDFAQRFLSGYLGSDTDMQKSLEQLWVSGWLEKRDSGYSMHPFIAECVRTDNLSEKDVAPFFERVIAAWEKTKRGFRIESVQDVLYSWNAGDEKSDVEEQELWRVTILVRYAVTNLACKFNERFVQFIILAVGIEHYTQGASKNTLALLTNLKARCKDISEKTKVCLYSMLCYYGYENLEELEKEYRKLFKVPDIPEELKQDFAEGLAERCVQLNIFSLGKELAEYLWESGVNVEKRMKGCLLFANIAMKKGDFEGYVEWLEKGAELGKINGREKSIEMYDILCALCSAYLPLKQLDRAQNVLEEMDDLLRENGSYLSRWKRLFYQGSLELYREDEGYGVNTLLEATKLAETLFIGTEDVTYASCLSELAMACHKAGRWKESSEHYKKTLSIYSVMPGADFDKMRIMNNMGVMYLDWSKPEEALTYLTQSWEIGKTMGGLPAAENANNLSRAWRMLGDREKELSYLREAAPVLEQFYGSEHPKVVDAKKRLAE